MSDINDRAGFRLPLGHPFTDLEFAWITFLRLLTDDRVSAPTLQHVQENKRVPASARGTT